MLDKKHAYVGMKVIDLNDNAICEITNITYTGVFVKDKVSFQDWFLRYEEISPYK